MRKACCSCSLALLLLSTPALATWREASTEKLIVYSLLIRLAFCCLQPCLPAFAGDPSVNLGPGITVEFKDLDLKCPLFGHPLRMSARAVLTDRFAINAL